MDRWYKKMNKWTLRLHFATKSRQVGSAFKDADDIKQPEFKSLALLVALLPGQSNNCVPELPSPAALEAQVPPYADGVQSSQCGQVFSICPVMDNIDMLIRTPW
jgi:hypothetical protein